MIIPRYLPFLDGTYSTAPGLVPRQKAATLCDRLLFQIDDLYTAYLHNKKRCRRENISKYYCESNLPAATAAATNKLIVKELTGAYPEHFVYHQSGERHTLNNLMNGETLAWSADWIRCDNGNYLSLFDGLCCQLQEDAAICQLSDSGDWMGAIHLCAPNHWDPRDKIGRPFHFIHSIVPGMEKTLQHAAKMLQSVVHKGPFTRFAWGIATDDRLNHHPLPPPGVDEAAWHGRSFSEATPVYLRVERQNLVGMPEHHAFLFTIRTFFHDIETLSREEKSALASALQGMPEDSRQYKGLSGRVDMLVQRLLRQT